MSSVVTEARPDRQVYRCIWITARLLQDGFLSYSEYRARFNKTDRTYYRDLSVICGSGAGIAIESIYGAGRIRLRGAAEVVHKFPVQARPHSVARVNAESGRRGGESVKAKYGPDFYREIGRQGGVATRRKLGTE